MATDHSSDGPAREPLERQALSDGIVPPAMLTVAAAAAVALHLHVGLAVELAAVMGLLLFAVALASHLIARSRATRAKVRRRRPAPRRMEAQSPGSAMAAPPGPGPVATTPAQMPAAALTAQPPAGGRPTAQPQRVAKRAAPPAVHDKPPAPEAPVQPPPVTWPEEAVALPPVPAAGPQRPAARVAPPDLPALDEIARPRAHVAWNLRPVELREPRADVPEPARMPIPAEARSAGAPTREAVPAPQSLREEEKRIDMILKRLAAQIQAGNAVSTPPAGAAMPAAGDAGGSDAALAGAVEALRATVDVMQTPPGASAAHPPGRAPATEPPRPPSEAEIRLAAVAEAVRSERADVFLEPILGLLDDRACHFEISVRLRGRDGRPLAATDIGEAARGSDLVPLLDGLRVRHSAGFALRLDRRGREGSVFSTVAGESLQSPGFVNGVAERHAFGIADRLVLSFEQSEMRSALPAQLEALARLRQLGFRFALQNVRDLDMDLEALKAAGFEFVKLDAEVFTGGLPLEGGTVPARDLCRHFASLGLTVIVGRIDDELVRARILGFGVLFGQGTLFGGARPLPLGSEAQSGAAA